MFLKINGIHGGDIEGGMMVMGGMADAQER